MSSAPSPPSVAGDGAGNDTGGGARNGAGSGNDGPKDASMAKTAGFVVFSGIAMSIIKALTPKPLPPPPPSSALSPRPYAPSPPPPPPPPLPEPRLEETSFKDSVVNDKSKPETVSQSEPFSGWTIDIARGDTLWGLSRKYGVTIDAIKEANGIKGDTIYAGKKLVIPLEP